MKSKKLINTIICSLILISFLTLNVNAADTSGTYDDTLTDGNNYIDVYADGEYIGEYTDYRMYWVDLDKDQEIELELEVPGGADFDLFVYTEDELRSWSSTSDRLGEDEELSIKAPETGEYKFVVAAWTGSGTFTLRWETPAEGLSSLLIYVLIGIVVVAIAIIIIILLMRRRKPKYLPPPPGNVPEPARAAPTPMVPQEPQQQCPNCGGPLTWIEQYKRWYCYKCSNYV
jgi:hypothetical protein